MLGECGAECFLDAFVGVVHEQEKIETIAKETYGAASVEYLPQAEKQIELYTRMGFAGLPICMAKTQYSFSADASAKVSPLPLEVLPSVLCSVTCLRLALPGGWSRTAKITADIVPSCSRLRIAVSLVYGLSVS